MAQDLLDCWGVIDQGDQAQAPIAARTSQTSKKRVQRSVSRPESRLAS